MDWWSVVLYELTSVCSVARWTDDLPCCTSCSCVQSIQSQDGLMTCSAVRVDVCMFSCKMDLWPVVQYVLMSVFSRYSRKMDGWSVVLYELTISSGGIVSMAFAESNFFHVTWGQDHLVRVSGNGIACKLGTDLPELLYGNNRHDAIGAAHCDTVIEWWRSIT